MTTGAQLGIGTAALGSVYGLGSRRVGADEAAGLLRAAIAAGVRYIDTAAAYGQAEAVVGRVAAAIVDNDVRVCTKIAAATALSGDHLASMRESLARLGLPRVDTLLLHSANAAALRDPALGVVLREVPAAGLSRLIGASTYGIDDASLALSQGWCQAVQLEHSVLNQSVLGVIAGRGHGAQIIARSVLCKGLLTERRASARGIVAGLRGTFAELESFACDLGLDLPGLAIRFALDSPGVDVVLVGVSHPGELETALAAAAHRPLTASELDALARFDRSEDAAVHPELWSTAAGGNP